MEDKTNSQTGESLANTVVPPAAFEHHANLKPKALQQAIKLGEKHPEIVRAASDLRSAYHEAGTKYLNLATQLRVAKLPKKEGTLLLLGLGLTKGRTSEILSLSAVGDDVWNQYTANTVGFRAALQLENGKKVPPGEPKKPREVAKVHKLPKEVASALADLLAKANLPMKNGKRTEYGFTYENKTAKSFVYVSLFADKD